MPTLTPIYGTPVTMTFNFVSLGSSSTLTAGRTSVVIDNKDVDDAVDALVGGKVRLGTSPTAGQIEFWAYASYDDVEYSGAAAGTDTALTPAAKECMKLLVVIPTG